MVGVLGQAVANPGLAHGGAGFAVAAGRFFNILVAAAFGFFLGQRHELVNLAAQRLAVRAACLTIAVKDDKILGQLEAIRFLNQGLQLGFERQQGAQGFTPWIFSKINQRL